jgi:hypothetical protein
MTRLESGKVPVGQSIMVVIKLDILINNNNNKKSVNWSTGIGSLCTANQNTNILLGPKKQQVARYLTTNTPFALSTRPVCHTPAEFHLHIHKAQTH